MSAAVLMVHTDAPRLLLVPVALFLLSLIAPIYTRSDDDAEG